MPITAKLDELGRPAWIAATILGFFVWWPIGLATLAFLIWSGRMSCGHYGHWERKMDWMRSRMSGGPNWGSGNRAFDEYRTETLKRLEDEQREFKDFLDRLRFAKDKTEFDEFMAERKDRSASDEPKGDQRPE